MNRKNNWMIIFFSLLLAAGLACQALSGDDSAADEEPLTSSSVDEEPIPPEEAVSSDVEEDEAGQEEESPAPTAEVEAEDASSEEEMEADTSESETLTLDQNNNFGVPSNESSYRVAFSMEINYTEGDDVSQVINIAGEGAVSTDPPASSFDFEVLGVEGASAFTNVSMVQIEDSTYIVSPIGGCVSGDFGQDLIDFDEFTDGGDFVGGVSGASLVERNVEINGVNTDHYSFNQDDLDGTGEVAGSVENFQGDLYVADDGHLVRMAFSGVGSIGFPGLPETGSSEMSYQLDYFDVGEPVDITVPEGCESGAELDLPILSDAEDLFSMSGLTSYTTSQGFQEIIDFYKSEMEGEGWSLDLDSSAEDGAMLIFSREGSTATVIVSEDSESGLLTVVITEQ